MYTIFFNTRETRILIVKISMNTMNRMIIIGDFEVDYIYTYKKCSYDSYKTPVIVSVLSLQNSFILKLYLHENLQIFASSIDYRF